MKSPIQPVIFKEKYLEPTLSFLAKFSPEHPELGDKELFLWQRCRRFLTFSRGRIVGHMAVIPQKFFVDGEQLTIGWGATLVLDMSDFAVKTFAGTALLDKIMNDPSYQYAGVGIVPEIESSYYRLGYVICRQSVRMYARFFKPSKALRYYGMPAIYSIPLRTINFFRRSSVHIVSGELIEIAEFDESHDRRWGEILSLQYEVYGERNASFLNYKMSQPRKKYRAFLHKDLSGEFDGYMVLREARHNTRDLFIIKICDLVGKSAAKRALLGRAAEIARELGVDGIVAVSSFRDRTIFKGSGLWLERVLPVGVKPELEGKMQLSFFDSDLDNLW